MNSNLTPRPKANADPSGGLTKTITLQLRRHESKVGLSSLPHAISADKKSYARERKSGRYILSLLESEPASKGSFSRYASHFRRFMSVKAGYRTATVAFAVVLIVQAIAPSYTAQKAFALNGNSNQTGYIWENDDASLTNTSATFGATAASDSSSGGSISWTNTGNVFADDNVIAATSSMPSAETSYYLKVTNFGFSLPATAAITGISVTVGKYASGASVRDDRVRIVKGGTIGTADRSKNGNWATSETAYTYGGNEELWGTTWTPSDINNSGFGFAISALNGSASTRVARADYISIVVYYSGANTQLAAGNTAISAPQGSRVNLRAQIKNTSSNPINFSDLGLFYDPGTGEWSKAEDTAVVKNAGIRSTPERIDATGDTGTYSSIAVDQSDNPWTSYYDATNSDLKIARYVGDGYGSGCDDNNWTCTSVDTANSVGQYTAITTDSSGTVWVSYYDVTNADLKVAQYVGSGGSGCASSAWTCTSVDTSNNVGQYTSIALDSSNNPWISYYDVTNADLKVAQYVGSGGSGCASSAWTCTSVDTSNNVGQYSSIDINSSGATWVSYYLATSLDLKVAQYVGSGGSGCASSAWTCTSVDTSNSLGEYSAIAVDATGTAWISYYYNSLTDFKIARYVSSGGSGCASSAWTCMTVDTSGTTGQYSSIALDTNNRPIASYYDSTNTALKVAYYVGTGKGSGCNDSAWLCSYVNTENSVGAHADLAVTSNNQLWFSFADATSSDILALKQVAQLSSNSCASSTLFTCQNIEQSNNAVGAYSSTAVDPSGNPWVSYYDQVNFDLKVARYVGGNNGSGCTDTNWSCYSVDTTNSTGQYTSIAIDSSGNPWVSYYNSTDSDLKVAQFVGSGAGSGCADSNWTCTSVETTNTVGEYTSIAINSSGNPWISYYYGTGLDLKVAQYVGSGGSGCASSAWTCTSVDTTGIVGTYNSIVIDASGNPWVSYYDLSSGDLKVAQYVGSGGSGCASSAWTCTSVDTTNSVGQHTAIAIDPTGNPWIAYNDASASDLKVAQYVGSGGSGCASSVWTCSVVESTGTVGVNISLAFDASGSPWVSFTDTSTSTLKAAHFVGSGAGSGCSNSNWSCLDIDFGTGVQYTSLAIDTLGNIQISYAINSMLRIATINRRGEIQLASSLNSKSAIISTSHADMTTTTDTANRDDADCVGGGTWNNGVMVWAEQGPFGSLPDGSGTAQCTEIVFTIDLTQATAGSTYRFMIATKDAVSSGKNYWRGPVSITSGAIPTLTVTESVQVVSQDKTTRLPNCTDTAWGCEAIDSTNDVGAYNSMIIDQAGVPWVSFYDTTNANLRVARYVGSTGGSGCDNAAWTCENIDTTSTVGQYSSIGIDPSGNPWISYYYGTGGDLRVAKYVGSGGSGCASPAWTCTNIDTTNDVGRHTSIAFDQAGNPWISYYEAASTSCDNSPTTECSLHVARYVGSGRGTGCASADWSCQIVENPTSTGNVGQDDTNITFGPDGSPWISYYDAGNQDLRVARFVGVGGSGCVDATWSCVSVDTTNAVGQYSSIAVDATNTAWVSYLYTTGTDIRVAQFVSSGGTGCASSAWTCTDVLTASAASTDTSIAIGPNGFPWVSSYSTASNALNVSRYIGGSSGSGCASSAWSCSVVDSSTAAYSRIAFDASGAPWVSYYGGSSDLKVSRLHISNELQSVKSALPFNGVNASSSFGRSVLTLGKSDSSDVGDCASGVTDLYGICGIYQNNGDYESTIANAEESLLISFAKRYTNTKELPTISWIGKTSLAPNTAGDSGDIYLQVYRYGTTNAWETLDSDTASSDCNTANCELSGIPSGTASEYFSIDKDGNYWVQYRVYQVASSSSSMTIKTDQISAHASSEKLRGGQLFQDGKKRALNQF